MASASDTRSLVAFRACRRLRIGLLVSGTTVLLALTALSPHRPEAASAQYDDCGFPPYTDDRSIALRHHISCVEAKRVLLRMKGNRRAHTVPMVCSRARVVQGWHLSNPGRSFGVVSTKYQRGRASFYYQRTQTPGREWCRPAYGTGEPVG